MAEESERYAFIADWYDATASIVRKYVLLFFPRDNSVELVDLKSKKVFLKRAKAEGLTADQLFVGASVNIFARQMKIVDFGDERTQRVLSNKQERVLVVVKPADVGAVGIVIDQLTSKGLVLANARMGFVAPSDAPDLFGDAPDLGAQASEGQIVALELIGGNAVAVAQATVGSDGARPGSSRARVAPYVSASASEAARQLELVFGGSSVVQPSPAFSNSTLCLIKPHAVAAGQAGKIVDVILKQGFQFGAIQTFTLDNASASEFLEVYKGVVAEYPAMVSALTAGTTLALEIVGGADVQQKFRDFVGPADPEIGRLIRKTTLRAQYGVDKIRNAVHCTDLAEDTVLEVDYFFKILA